MTDFYLTKNLPVFTGESKAYPAWRGKFYSGCCDRNPHVLNSSIPELEDLKVLDVETVLPNETEAAKNQKFILLGEVNFIQDVVTGPPMC